MRECRLALLMTICVATTCAAQAEPFPLSFAAPPQLSQNAREAFEKLAKEHADAMHVLLLEQIDAIDAECGLTEQQASTLRLAAKGAVQDSLEAWLAPIRSVLASDSPGVVEVMAVRLQLTSSRGRQVRVENAPFVVQERVLIRGNEMFRAKRIDGVPNATAQALEQANAVMLEMDDVDVLLHDIFRSAVESTLTPQQRQKIEPLTAEAAKSEARIHAGRLANVLAERLSLNRPQWQVVRQFIEDQDDARVRHWLAGRSTLTREEAADIASMLLPREELREILSPQQYANWQRTVREKVQIMPLGGVPVRGN